MQTVLENELAIKGQAIKSAAMVFRAINHPLRLQILRFIHSKGKTIVTDIYSNMKLEQSVTSQHLAIMRREGIVSDVREGKYIYYSVNYKRLKAVQEFAGEMVRLG